jgi:hypothetical protein
MTNRHTEAVARPISVRLDDEAERALRLIEATGLSRSEAIRSSLLASAQRIRRRREIAAEVAALEADEADRSEMLAVASLMEAIRATR